MSDERFHHLSVPDEVERRLRHGTRAATDVIETNAAAWKQIEARIERGSSRTGRRIGGTIVAITVAAAAVVAAIVLMDDESAVVETDVPPADESEPPLSNSDVDELAPSTDLLAVSGEASPLGWGSVSPPGAHTTLADGDRFYRVSSGATNGLWVSDDGIEWRMFNLGPMPHQGQAIAVGGDTLVVTSGGGAVGDASGPTEAVSVTVRLYDLGPVTTGSGSGIEQTASVTLPGTANLPETSAAGAAAVGPQGVVIAARGSLTPVTLSKDAFGIEFADQLTEASIETGVLHATSASGETRSASLTDLGLAEVDLDALPGGAVDLWHSPDGASWTPVYFDDRAVTALVATDDGFYSLDNSGAVAASRDGLAWNIVHCCFEAAPPMGVWNGGAVLDDGQGIWRITFAGPELLFTTDERPEADFIMPQISGSDLGIVAARGSSEYVYSPDGIDWVVASLPDNSAPANVFIPSWLAIDDEAVLVTAQPQIDGQYPPDQTSPGTPKPVQDD